MDNVWNWIKNVLAIPLLIELIVTITFAVLGLLAKKILKSIRKQSQTKEYLQKIDSANRAVVEYLIPGVSMGDYPTRELIASLLEAESSKNAVKKSEVYSRWFQRFSATSLLNTSSGL